MPLWKLQGKDGLEPGAARQAPPADAAPTGPPARLLPSLCSLRLCSCCEVRKHCEWCRALVCRHEKPSALLKGRTACCHSETGTEAASREDFSLGRHYWVQKRSTFSKSGQKFLEGEAEKGEKEENIYPTKSDSVYSNVAFPQKVALLSLPVTM